MNHLRYHFPHNGLLHHIPYSCSFFEGGICTKEIVLLDSLLLPEKIVHGKEATKELLLGLRSITQRSTHESISICQIQIKFLVGRDQSL
jgi:hypothetical protein